MSSKRSDTLDSDRDSDHQTYKIIGNYYQTAVECWKRSADIDGDGNKSDDNINDCLVKHLVHAKVARNLAKLEITLRKAWNEKYRNNSHFGTWEQVHLRKELVKQLEREIANDEWDEEMADIATHAKEKRRREEERSTQIRKSALDAFNRIGEDSPTFIDREYGNMDVRDREIFVFYGTEIRTTVPDAYQNLTRQSSTSADGDDGQFFRRLQEQETHVLLHDEGLQYFDQFVFRERELSYIFRASGSHGELALEDSHLFYERLQEIKKTKKQHWQRQEASNEARKSTISEEEWAIKKLVARELERQKFAKDEMSRVIWPHHREAAEQLSREQLARWRSANPRLHHSQQKRRNEELVDAARNGLDERVKLLLHNGADVDYTSSVWGTALHVATLRGRQENIALLLEADSNVNALDSSRQTPLDVAATYANSGGVQTLLTAKGWVNVDGGGGNVWGPPVFAAATANGVGFLPAVQALIRRNASREWAFETAPRVGLVKKLIAASEFDHNVNWRDGARLSPTKSVKLIQAVTIMNRVPYILEWLLEKNMHDGEDLEVLRQDAVWLGHKESAQVLFAYRANVNGRRALMLVAAKQQGRSNAIDILQELGATELAQDG